MFGQHVNATAELVLQVLLDRDYVEQTTPGRQVYEYVDIAVRSGIAARNGTEQADTGGAMPRCRLAYDFALL
jgi:hypothetical protein